MFSSKGEIASLDKKGEVILIGNKAKVNIEAKHRKGICQSFPPKS